MPKALTRVALISILFVASVASFQAQTPGSAPAGYPAAGQPAIVTLVAPGAAPRTALRYTIGGDYKAHMDMAMLLGMSMEMAGIPAQTVQMPEMKMGADVGVRSVTPSGDVTFDFAYTSVTLDQTAGVDPSLASLVQGMDADLKKVRGSATMNTRGATHGSSMDISNVSDPRLTQMLGSLATSLDSVTIPLPEEAVGAGARWESRDDSFERLSGLSEDAVGARRRRRQECQAEDDRRTNGPAAADEQPGDAGRRGRVAFKVHRRRGRHRHAASRRARADERAQLHDEHDDERQRWRIVAADERGDHAQGDDRAREVLTLSREVVVVPVGDGVAHHERRGD